MNSSFIALHARRHRTGYQMKAVDEESQELGTWSGANLQELLAALENEIPGLRETAITEAWNNMDFGP